jgi:hypothetical protein
MAVANISGAATGIVLTLTLAAIWESILSALCFTRHRRYPPELGQHERK